MVPRKGLEPPRCYPLVPETSASTNSATWAFQEVLDSIIKKNTSFQPTPVGAELMSEVEGTVQGHRDGHGFLIRDDRQPDLYLSPQEMRAVLHRDIRGARWVGLGEGCTQYHCATTLGCHPDVTAVDQLGRGWWGGRWWRGFMRR